MLNLWWQVPRNIRLALQAIDIVQPYVVLDRLAAVATVQATVQPGASVQLQWRVGGALEVGTTQIEERVGHGWHEWSKVGDALEGGEFFVLCCAWITQLTGHSQCLVLCKQIIV